MVERKHTTNDTIGKNTIPESFELGDYVTLYKKTTGILEGDPCYLLATTDTTAIGGGVFGKTYSGFSLTYFTRANIQGLNFKIQELATAGKADAIAFIFTFPKNLLLTNFSVGLAEGTVLTGVSGNLSITDTLHWVEMSKNFAYKGDTYIPHNNKLYCYPFNFITIKNSSGGNVVLKMELFNDIEMMNYAVDAVITQNPHITLTPLDYSGKAFAIDDSITMQDFPLCSWNNDNYANWYAQHVNTLNAQSSNATSSYKANQNVMGANFSNKRDNMVTSAEKGAINTAISTVGAVGTGNFLGGASSAIGGAANTFLDYQQSGRNAQNDLSNSDLMNTVNYQNQIKSIVASVADSSVQPNTCKGSTASSGLDLSRGTANFFVEQIGIKPEYARIIDSYFQMFGYQVNSVEIPNFKTRTRWNYLKCVNTSTYGNIPFEDIQAINEMFNNGLTIWHDESYMYNYSVNNIII